MLCYVILPFHNVMLCYFAILFCYVIVMLGRDEGPALLNLKWADGEVARS